jgi:uncharacterized membrane protein
MFFLVASLTSALLVGAADFYSGRASRATPVALVGLLGQSVGFILAVVIVLTQAIPFAPECYRSGVIGGISGSIALLAIYRGLAIGRVAVVAPVSAVIGALLPTLFSIAQGHAFATPKLAAIILGIIAIYLLSLPSVEAISEPQPRRQRESGFFYAVIGGLGTAGFYLFLGNPEAQGNIWVLLGERSSVVAIMLILSIFGRQLSQFSTAPLKMIILAGLCDIFGNLAFLYSCNHGPLPIAALIASLYPASTMLLGWLVLKDPIGPRLRMGASCAFVSILLFGWA